MRQVPGSHTTPIGIVGDGRVATHFRHYFGLLGLPVRAWSRRAAAAGPDETLAGCDPILLLINDGAIAPLVRAHPRLTAHRLVHCSGALVTTVAEAAHPLMTFGHALYDLDAYRRIPFIVDAEGAPFNELFPGLPNPSFTLRREDRPYYHALCVMAGNFSTLLWLKLFTEFENRFGVPAAAAHPYLARVADNLQHDPARALTGPLSRGDTGTVRANLDALAGDPFQAVYAAFARAYAHRP